MNSIQQNLNTQEIWKKFKKDLYSFILGRVSTHEDAQDILQSVFEKIHKHSQKLTEIENISGWVFAITRNEIISYYRGRTYYAALHEEVAQPENNPSIGERMEFIAKCMNVFTEEFSAEDKSILAAMSEGKSVKRIAEELGKPYSTIKSRSLRSREKIRRKFIACCGPLEKIDDNGIEYQSCGSC